MTPWADIPRSRNNGAHLDLHQCPRLALMLVNKQFNAEYMAIYFKTAQVTIWCGTWSALSEIPSTDRTPIPCAFLSNLTHIKVIVCSGEYLCYDHDPSCHCRKSPVYTAKNPTHNTSERVAVINAVLSEASNATNVELVLHVFINDPEDIEEETAPFHDFGHMSLATPAKCFSVKHRLLIGMPQWIPVGGQLGMPTGTQLTEWTSISRATDAYWTLIQRIKDTPSFWLDNWIMCCATPSADRNAWHGLVFGDICSASKSFKETVIALENTARRRGQGSFLDFLDASV